MKHNEWRRITYTTKRTLLNCTAALVKEPGDAVGLRKTTVLTLRDLGARFPSKGDAPLIVELRYTEDGEIEAALYEESEEVDPVFFRFLNSCWDSKEKLIGICGEDGIVCLECQRDGQVSCEQKVTCCWND